MSTLKLGAKNRSKRAVSKAKTRSLVPSDVTGSTPTTTGYVPGGYVQPEESDEIQGLRKLLTGLQEKEAQGFGMSGSVDREKYVVEQSQTDAEGNTLFTGVETETAADGTAIGSSVGDVLLGRVGHLEPRLQAGIKHVAQGGVLSGSSDLETAATMSKFVGELGGDAKAWAEQIKVDESVGLPVSKQDVRTVYSVLGKTSGEYLDKGPGSNLAGHTLLKEKTDKQEDDLQLAYQYIKDISEHYVHDKSQGASRATRVEGVEASLTDRFLNGVFAKDAKSIIPLPNETGVSGLKPTMSFRGYVGTKFDRLGFSNFAEEKGISADSLGDDDKEMFWSNMPSAKNSLVPRKRLDKNATKAEKEKAKDDQSFAYDTLLYKAHTARNILREQFPTNFDESMGNIRSVNKNKTYDDDEVQRNLTNEANILGLDFAQASTDVATAETAPSQHKDASDRGGMYGERPLSEVDVFQETGKTVDQLIKEEENEDFVGPKYTKKLEGIEQRTPEWHKARKGIVTASTLIDKNGKQLSADEMGEILAKRKLGLDKDFIGNDYTEEGTKNEEMVLASFLKSQKKLGKNFTHEEVGLLTNKDLPGMGASPDGRLSLDGKNAGLVELKYLTTDKMDGALKKYSPQMQLQMLVTGEKEMYFHAYDRYTDDTITEKVVADEAFQKDLKLRIDKAVAIGEGLDVESLFELEQGRNKKEEDKVKQTKAERDAGIVADDTSGQTKSFSKKKAVELPMKGFRVPVKEPDSMEKLYGPLSQEELNWRDSDPAKNFIAAADNKSKQEAKASQEKADADKKSADAAKDTANSLKELGREAKDAAGALGEIAGFVMGGDSKSTDLRIRAAAAGVKEKNLLGLERELKKSGLSQDASNNLVGNVTDVAKDFADYGKGATAFKDLQHAQGKSALPEIRNMELTSLEDRVGLNTQQQAALILKENQSLKSVQAKMAHADMYGAPNIVALGDRTTPEAVREAVDEGYDDDAQAATHRGIQKTFIKKEEAALETTKMLGETGGEILGGLQIAAGVVGSLTMGYLGSKAAGTVLKSGTKAGSKVVNTVNKAGSKTINVLKNTANVTGKTTKTIANSALNVSKAAAATKVGSAALRATPAGAAVGAISYAARELTGVEDDGSLADSAMDVLEFAATGAAIGSVIPGVGTVVGGAVGALGGLANEAYEHFSRDVAVPTKDIPSFMQGSEPSNQPTIYNIEVSNSITKDSVVTEVTENGDQVYIEEDETVGF